MSICVYAYMRICVYDYDLTYMRICVYAYISICAYAYDMTYVKDINPDDEVLEQDGVKIFIDPAAIMFLLGTTMDFKTDKFKSGFVFMNPNETERCGCGESFSV